MSSYPKRRKSSYVSGWALKMGAMWAIIESGGKQLKVSRNMRVVVECLKGKEEGTEVEFGGVLAVGNSDGVRIGMPFVEGALVKARVVKHFKAPRVIVFKKKRRKGYKRKYGHRQRYTLIEITDIKTS